MANGRFHVGDNVWFRRPYGGRAFRGVVTGVRLRDMILENGQDSYLYDISPRSGNGRPFLAGGWEMGYTKDEVDLGRLLEMEQQKLYELEDIRSRMIQLRKRMEAVQE